MPKGGRRGRKRLPGESATYLNQLLIQYSLIEHPSHLWACPPQVEDILEVQELGDKEEDINR
jgi:hypothetical protein